jgi:hypothetical protein
LDAIIKHADAVNGKKENSKTVKPAARVSSHGFVKYWNGDTRYAGRDLTPP